jgi:hypothetical protein
MNIKTTYSFLFSFLFITNFSIAQLKNMNPDPFGEPWIAGGFRIPSAAEMKIINNIPDLVLPADYLKKSLPPCIDNSMNQYFRPIFNQVGGSCAQASGVGYNYTYEMCFRRNKPANSTFNQYPTHFTYNFLNDGSNDNGSSYFDGWNIIKYCGCPNVAEYGVITSPNIRWMSNYSKYYNGMFNRIQSVFKIRINTPEGLQVLKNYLNDHIENAPVGGLVNFSAGADYEMRKLPAYTHMGGLSVIIKWGEVVNHAMTIAGYDDSIRYDFNGDGIYTNNKDINNDGKVDMKDWEIGGLIVVNSWGDNWGNQGKCYMMYKLLAESTKYGGIWNSSVYGIKVRTDYSPFLTFKVKLKHNSRKQIRIIGGSSPDINATKPSFTFSFPIFNYQGGNFFMQGGSSLADQTIEFGLDATPLLSNIPDNQPAKFFLTIIEDDPEGNGSGELVAFSAISYTQGIDETVCASTNVPLNNNSSTTFSVIKSVSFKPLNILNDQLPNSHPNKEYNLQLNAEGGTPPYLWSLKMKYNEEPLSNSFPEVKTNLLRYFDNDDDVIPIALSFSFPFYGKQYDTVYVSTDGSLLFDGDFCYVRSDKDLIENKAISVFGADLQIYPDDDGIWYESDQNHATFYWKVSEFEKIDSDIEVAISIFPNGSIFFYYGDKITNDIKWTGGISNGDLINYTIESFSNAPSIGKKVRRKFISIDFPLGINLTKDGMLSGKPLINDRSYNLSFVVTDLNNMISEKTLPLVVGHEDNLIEEVSFSLFPNPFDDYIVFSAVNHSITEKKISVEIFNMSGIKVKELCNEIWLKNNYDIYWNGSDNSDIPLPTGVYIVKIVISNTTTIRKIIIL